MNLTSEIATNLEVQERRVALHGLLGLPDQDTVVLDAWGGTQVTHRNHRFFILGKFCPAAEPTELTEPVLTAAIELEAILNQAGKEFHPELIHGDLSPTESSEWTESRPAGLIVKHEELWCLRQAADGTYRFCLVYWKSECRLGQEDMDIWKAPTFFMPLATSWAEGLTELG